MDNLELYNKAKEAYYSGEPILSDIEFDELEKSIGLENKSYIGAHGKTDSYTIKHPVTMGSLSKVQIKNDSNGNINWVDYFNELSKYVYKYVNNCKCIITPKYDGCSFELVNDMGNITISSRGDGIYGKDLFKFLYPKIKNYLFDSSSPYILRGEVLIKRAVFEKKYTEFVNSRSFVSGILNRKFEDIDNKEMVEDLSIVIYDYKIKNEEWVDKDWLDLKETKLNIFLPEYYIVDENLTKDAFVDDYYWFEDYRSHSLYALDGFVIKPNATSRKYNSNDTRPKDCVAIKFRPILKETTIVDIIWQLGYTGEYTPVIITEPVIMDGKKVNKASANNYGYCLTNKLSIGAKVILSLAGDIIPFIYKITSQSNNELILPENSYISGCHLMKTLSERDKSLIDFVKSCNVLNIKGLGPKQAEYIFNSISKTRDNNYPNNILDVSTNEIEAIDESKIIKNIVKGYKDLLQNKLTLAMIIESCNFPFCGTRMSEQVANYITGQTPNFSSMASEGYCWVYDVNSEKYSKLISLMDKLDSDSLKKASKENTEGKIKVILTGSPANYDSKKDFLSSNPQYVETSKWNECKILFTGDLESMSSKMLKAKKNGIEIKQY